MSNLIKKTISILLKYPNGRRTLSILLSLTLTLSLLPATALAAEIEDIAGHWAAAAIEKCHTYGIMSGDGNGNYRPGDPITRAEYMAMVNLAFNFTETEGAAAFTDVPEGTWYANDIKIASAMGYMDGVGGGKAAPLSNTGVYHTRPRVQAVRRPGGQDQVHRRRADFKLGAGGDKRHGWRGLRHGQRRQGIAGSQHYEG